MFIRIHQQLEIQNFKLEVIDVLHSGICNSGEYMENMIRAILHVNPQSCIQITKHTLVDKLPNYFKP